MRPQPSWPHGALAPSSCPTITWPSPQPLDGDKADAPPDFYLGPLRSVRLNRVAFVAASGPAQQAAGVLRALGSLKHGPWWPPLPDIIDTARGFYPGRLADSADVEVQRPAPTQG